MADELVRCGCGGEAFVSINGFIEYHVVCALCGMRTDWFRSKDKAIEAWNKAMERTAKVKEAWGLTMCCACKKRVFPYDKYCSHCGARLEWK